MLDYYLKTKLLNDLPVSFKWRVFEIDQLPVLFSSAKEIYI